MCVCFLALALTAALDFEGPDPFVGLTLEGLAVHRAASSNFELADAALRAHLAVDAQGLSASLSALADAAARATQLLHDRRQGDVG